MSVDNFYNQVVYLNHFDGTDGATTSPDESKYVNGQTFNGNAEIDTAQSVFGGASLLLDGTGDNVSAPDADHWNIGGMPFTMEARIRLTSLTGSGAIVSQYNTSTNNRNFILMYDGSTNNLVLFWSTNGTNFSSIQYETWVPVVDTWYAVAVDRETTGENSGASIRLYIDGVMVEKDTGSGADDVFYGGSNAVFMVGDQEDGGRDFNGHIDDVRVTIGIARYADDAGYTLATTAFPNEGPTPDVIDHTQDFNYDNVVLRLTMEGTDGDTTTTDVSDFAQTVNILGTSELSNLQKKFGTTSYKTNAGSLGLAETMSVTYDASLNAAGSAFTAECWFYLEASGVNNIQHIISMWDYLTPDMAWSISYFKDLSTFKFRVSVSGTTKLLRVGAGRIIANGGWHFIAVDKTAAGVYRMYLDGIFMGSLTSSETLHTSTKNLVIANGSSTNHDLGMEGYIDDLRYTIGVARYATDNGFNVPTSAFPVAGVIIPNIKVTLTRDARIKTLTRKIF